MKPMLKAPGFPLLKLTYDEALSHVAFKFNLRRYSQGKAQKSFLSKYNLDKHNLFAPGPR
jgi:hypothetical protein